MRNWAEWRSVEARRRRSLAGQKGAHARWAAERAARAGEPIRLDRVVEITIRDSHRPQRVIRLMAHPTEHGWSRWGVLENGVRVGKRRIGSGRLWEILAASLA